MTDKQRLLELERQLLRLVNVLQEYKSQTDMRIVVMQQQIQALSSAMTNLSGAMENMAAAATLAIEGDNAADQKH